MDKKHSKSKIELLNNQKKALISHTFDARVEDPESEPIEVVIYRREIVDIEVQKGASLFPITLLLVYARARAWARAQREQPHCIESLTLISPNVF